MAFGVGEIVVVLAIVAVALVLLPLLRRPEADRADEWALFNGVVLTRATGPVVERYLDNRYALRRIGAISGVLLAPAITAAFGIDLHITGYAWVLLGYLLGVIVAELALARVPSAGVRTASLATRRLVNYAPKRLLVAQVALPSVTVLLAVGIAAARKAEPYIEGQRIGAIWAAPVVVLVAIGTMVGQHHFVRRPQPSAAPDVLDVDDALRSSAVRLIGATSATLSALMASAQLAYLATRPGTWGGEGGPFLIASLAMAFVAWLCWRARLPRRLAPRSDREASP
jgi:hypothetical protein